MILPPTDKGGRRIIFSLLDIRRGVPRPLQRSPMLLLLMVRLPLLMRLLRMRLSLLILPVLFLPLVTDFFMTLSSVVFVILLPFLAVIAPGGGWWGGDVQRHWSSHPLLSALSLFLFYEGIHVSQGRSSLYPMIRRYSPKESTAPWSVGSNGCRPNGQRRGSSGVLFGAYVS